MESSFGLAAFALFSICFNVDAAKTLDVDRNVLKLSEANIRFSINLYKQLASDESTANLVFSPVSISTAMAMLHLGAKGDTAKQIDDALLFSNVEDGKFHSAFGELHGRMFEQKSDNVTLKSSNRVFAGYNSGILDDYKHALTVYSAKVEELDFGNSEAAANTVNSWVKETTDGKISDIVSDQDFSPNLAMVLANTMYFKGDWHSQFVESHTEKRAFFVSHYRVVETPFMFQRGQFRYGYIKSLTLQIVELDYANKEFSMVILLPENFDLSTVEKEVTYENLTKWISNLKHRNVDLTLPKFKIEESLELHNIFPKMGVLDVFQGGKADLTDISKTALDLHVDQVLHKAVLEVDEKGSEAAAATKVRLVTRSMPNNPQFLANQPFLWGIVHKPLGHIVFMGRLVRPSGELRPAGHDEF